MTNKRPATLILAFGLASCALVSCGKVKNSVAKASNPIKKLSALNSNDWKMFKLGDLRSDSPPIVEVRRKDLKKMETSEEKILAWNRSKRASKLAAANPEGAFFMPEDFDPSTLPSGDFDGSSGILPSLRPEVPPIEETVEEPEAPAEDPAPAE